MHSVPTTPNITHTRARTHTHTADFVVLPLFNNFVHRFTAAKPLLRAVLSNYRHWKVEAGRASASSGSYATASHHNNIQNAQQATASPAASMPRPVRRNTNSQLETVTENPLALVGGNAEGSGQHAGGGGLMLRIASKRHGGK